LNSALLLDTTDTTTALGDLDLDVQIAPTEQPAGTGGFGTPGGYTSPNLTYGVQSPCPTCC
jgi:lantipeptide (TIGR04451 family)